MGLNDAGVAPQDFVAHISISILALSPDVVEGREGGLDYKGAVLILGRRGGPPKDWAGDAPCNAAGVNCGRCESV
eukprot:scaffold106584_cov31-Tisochrysis_lutea.AAC.1